MAKVVHLTSVHVPFDTRIFQKECRTLAEAGHEVVLLAPHDRTEVVAGVRVEGVRPRPGRFARMALRPLELYRRARAENADVYHLHDPELLPVGAALSRGGRKVVWDSHEDLPVQLLTKEWVPEGLRPLVSRAAGTVERACVARLSAVVSAEPAGAARFRHPDVVVVQNWPRLDEFPPIGTPYAEREPLVVYVGSITAARGARAMARAVNLLESESPARLEMAGTLAPPALEQEIRAADPAGRVRLLGFQDRSSVGALLARARVGLVVLQPTAQYRATQPVKLFEYMAAGVPYVASDFALWRELVGSSDSGLFVDPQEPAAIAEAVSWLLDHPEEASEMGARGRHHVERMRSWDAEASKLLELYERLLAS